MDLQDATTGASGGLISAFLIWIGFKSRLDKLEKSVDGVVSKDTFDQFEKRVIGGIETCHDAIGKVNVKLDKIVDRAHDSRTSDTS